MDDQHSDEFYENDDVAAIPMLDTPSHGAMTPSPPGIRLPDELMMIIYDFCPRSTLVNCIVLDHRQFDLVVKRLWRVFDSPKLNLESITARRLNRVRRRKYFSAIRHYRTKTRWSQDDWETPMRFRPSRGLDVLVKRCPNVLRLDCLYEEDELNTFKLFFRRASTGKWTELEMEVGAAAHFVKRELHSFVSQTVFGYNLPDLVLTRLAINLVADEPYGEHKLRSLVQWIQPYIKDLRKLEIGPGIKLYGEEIPILGLIRPTISSLCLYGPVTDDVLAHMISRLPRLRDIAYPRMDLWGNEPLLRVLSEALINADLEKVTLCTSSRFWKKLPNSLNRPAYLTSAILAGSSGCDILFVDHRETLFMKEPWNRAHLVPPSDNTMMLALQHAMNDGRFQRSDQSTSETPSESA